MLRAPTTQVLVSEPSVPDTINILRGLSERYSSFHGVRILDRALVVAAELSDRYITSRFLPDKAIDLVDEACSNVRVQLDSLPEDIDRLQRKRIALQVQTVPLSICLPNPAVRVWPSARLPGPPSLMQLSMLWSCGFPVWLSVQPEPSLCPHGRWSHGPPMFFCVLTFVSETSPENLACGCQVEEAALSKEKDKQSKERLTEVKQELAQLGEELQPLLMRYNQEKKRLDEIRRLQKKVEELKVRIEEAENRMDLAMVADLK
jgi:ATP-dependent Clp protease ATP-binding subunit ClpA